MNRVMWEPLNGENGSEKHCGNCRRGTNGARYCSGRHAYIKRVLLMPLNYLTFSEKYVLVVSKCSGKGNWVPKDTLMIKDN